MCVGTAGGWGGTRRPWLAGRSAPCGSEVSFPGTAPAGPDKLLAGQPPVTAARLYFAVTAGRSRC